MCMKKDTFSVNNWTKIAVWAVILLCLSGIGLLFAQTGCIEPMDELFPELKWLNNKDMDGIELPSMQEKSKNLLDGLEIPLQRPRNKFDGD